MQAERPIDLDDSALDDDSPYCACGAVHGIEEQDSGICDCCGRTIE